VRTLRRSAVTRLLDHYLITAATATQVAFPRRGQPLRPVPEPATPTPEVGEPARARAWLDAERPTLAAAVAHAAADGSPQHAGQLAAALARYLLVGSHLVDTLAIHGTALRVAEACRDEAGTAVALSNLGLVRG
jgi:hypothetical protein